LPTNLQYLYPPPRYHYAIISEVEKQPLWIFRKNQKARRKCSKRNEVTKVKIFGKCITTKILYLYMKKHASCLSAVKCRYA
jgi:hypothetical protein